MCAVRDVILRPGPNRFDSAAGNSISSPNEVFPEPPWPRRPTLRSFSSSAVAISIGFLPHLFVRSRLHFLKGIPFINDAQSLQGQEFIDFADRGTFRRYQGCQPSRGHDFGLNSVFLLDTLNDTVYKTHIAKKDSRLDGVNRVFPHHLFGLHNLDSRQFRCPLEQCLQRNQQPWRNSTADVFAPFRYKIHRRRGPKVHYDTGVAIFLISRNAINNTIGAYVFGTIIQNGHSGLNPGTNHERFELEELDGQFLGNADHRRDDARTDYRMNLIAPEPF